MCLMMIALMMIVLVMSVIDELLACTDWNYCVDK